MQAGRLMRALFAASLLPVLSCGCGARSAVSPPVSAGSLSVASSTTQRREPVGIVSDFTDVVQQNGPAVVNLSASGPTPVANLTPLWPPASNERDPFVQFFRQFAPNQPSEPALPPGTLGSGFIISPDGYILTDAQVVAGAAHIKVKLTDRREFKATVVGIDAPSDVALLKIAAHGLPTVKIGKPSTMKVGEWVVSIGSPYGLENTVTAGIISNRSRLLEDETYIPMIQTDLTLSAGDSGGPLCDLNGAVIGIEAPVHRSFEGLSFAIPIDAAMRIEQQLQAHGEIEHGRLGVTIQEVSAPLARSFGMSKPVGALISSTDRGGPSDKAGLLAGDVILQINGQAIDDSTQLPMAVADLLPGSAVRVKYWRNRETQEASVVLGSMRGDSQAAAAPGRTAVDRFGLTVRGLTANERRSAGVSGGVRVEKSSGPAALAGILPGDVISRVDNRPVSNVTQLRDDLHNTGKSVALLVQRDGHPVYVAIDLG